ncbi:MAG: hypothetical protein ABEH64_07220 [Salinirussus sp.]
MLRRTASWLANRDGLPTTVRAVLGFYANAGAFDIRSLRLKRRVDTETDAMLDEAFEAVETALAEEFGRSSVEFSYDTKLILPAQLALGYLYRRVNDPADQAHVEELTALAIEALLDGDMRDARNDAEYDDFAVDFPTDRGDRARVAAIAQETLEARVVERFEAFDDGVAEAYEWAVNVSEAHQADDERFRALLDAAENGDDAARQTIREEYREAEFDDTPRSLTATDCELPYARTQYDRVGVIYDGMLRMYAAEGFPIDPAFERSIILAIVGAQIWLDDVDDYRSDRREGQLTPVTAEYLLAPDDATAKRRVIEVSEAYLERAAAAADTADSPLTGIAAEYIYRSGAPETLPG